MKTLKPETAATKKFNLGSLRNVTAKAVTVSAEELVSFAPLDEGGTLPVVARPNLPHLDLAAWAQSNREQINALLPRHGGILFRGFELGGLEDFRRFLEALHVELMHYMESATPRTALADRIYTSTEYPSNQTIALHNELSTSTTFPRKVWFLCLEPAAEGGETPVADVRRVFRRIAPEIRERFIRKGWMLVRNFGEGAGIPWQTSFHTTDKSVLEAYCRSSNVEFEWKGEDQLRTRQVRTAVARHPLTGEMVWFNHVAFWHVSSLEPHVREAMLTAFPVEDLPYNTYYGDGEPIEDSVVEHLREAYRAETVAFPWQRGDLLMLDNILVAHGRRPFTGTRKILAAMGEPSSDRNL